MEPQPFCTPGTEQSSTAIIRRNSWIHYALSSRRGGAHCTKTMPMMVGPRSSMNNHRMATYRVHTAPLHCKAKGTNANRQIPLRLRLRLVRNHDCHLAWLCVTRSSLISSNRVGAFPNPVPNWIIPMSCVQWPCHILRLQLFVFARASELDLWRSGEQASQQGGAVRQSDSRITPESGQSRAPASSGRLGNRHTVRLPA